VAKSTKKTSKKKKAKKAAKPQRASAGKDGKRIRPECTCQNRNRAYQRQLYRFHRRPPQLEDGLNNQRNHDRLNSVENSRGLRQRSEAHVRPRQPRDHDRRGQDETDSRDQQARPTCTHSADVDRYLGGVWSGNEIGRAQKIQKLFARQPAAARDGFVFHHCDVRRRAAKSDCAQL